MPSYSGVWTLPAVMQAIGSQNWPSYVDTSKRGLVGGLSTWSNVLNYFTMTTTGNATYFGALITYGTGGPDYVAGGIASSTRGIYAGGSSSNPYYLCVIQYVTIATTGDATNFGSLSSTFYASVGCSNSTRGLVAGGLSGGASSVN